MATSSLLAEANAGLPSTPAEKPASPGGAPTQHWTRSLWLHGALLLVTFATTATVGMRYAYNFQLGLPPLSTDADVFPYRWVWQNISSLGTGLPFAATLLAILLAHEFGHYFACRAYGISCSLPYLLPAPTLSGTAGAIIRLRTRVSHRAALLVIGAAGPIAGFVIAIVTTVIGLVQSRQVVGTPPVSLVNFHAPLLMTFLQTVLHRIDPSVPPVLMTVPNPILVASWVGLLITSINLMPAGQLDGGHIVYAISPRAHRYFTHTLIVVLLVMGAVAWVGWLLWAILLLIPAMKHPRLKEEAELHRWHYALVPLCLLILLFTFTVQPFSDGSLADLIQSSFAGPFAR